MARRVYANHKQYRNVNELREMLEDVWDYFYSTYIATLYRSIPRRLLDVMYGKGAATKY